MKRFLQLLFSRLTFVAFFMALQIGAIVAMLTYFRSRYADFYTLFTIIGAIAVIYILNQEENPAYKIAWIIPILVLPIFGIPLYFLFGKSRLPKSLRMRMSHIQSKYDVAYENVDSCLEALKEIDPAAARQAEYLESAALAPIFQHSETEYFQIGRAHV